MDKNGNPLDFTYFAPEAILGSDQDNDRMLAMGMETVRTDERQNGFLVAGNYRGFLAGATGIREGWRGVVGYASLPDQNRPAFRYFVIDYDNFRRDEFIATTRARGLAPFDFMQALRGPRHKLSESTALGGTNPLRFVGTDLDGRGKGLVFGLVRKEAPGNVEWDAEIVAYLTEKLWLGGGYREVDDGIDVRSHIKLTGGWTPGFYYGLRHGDMNLRSEVGLGKDPYFVIRFIYIPDF